MLRCLFDRRSEEPGSGRIAGKNGVRCAFNNGDASPNQGQFGQRPGTDSFAAKGTGSARYDLNHLMAISRLFHKAGICSSAALTDAGPANRSGAGRYRDFVFHGI